MLRSAGGAVAAVDVLFQGRGSMSSRYSSAPASFAIVRPPGHHCCGKTAAGFCLLNNTAVAAAHAKQVLGLERIAIIDWDYHHGDGTQKIFYDDPSVLTLSVHAGMEFLNREENSDGVEDSDGEEDSNGEEGSDGEENGENGEEEKGEEEKGDKEELATETERYLEIVYPGTPDM